MRFFFSCTKKNTLRLKGFLKKSIDINMCRVYSANKYFETQNI